MGVRRGDRYDLLGDDTKTWDKAGPPDAGVRHGPAETTRPQAGVPLPSLLKQWGLCSEKRPFSPR